MGGNESRADLSRFLRSRRERLLPEEVGLPGGPRRRSPGLRREEIAVLAGVSPTWYTYLEQGRNIRPSTEVLASLARVLQLTPEERRYLYLLANGQTPPIEPSDVRTVADKDIGHVVEAMDVSDSPLYAGTIFGDVTFWNDAAVRWYGDFARLPEGRRNMLWWMLLAPEARERLVDWEEDTKDFVARFRLTSMTWPRDERVQSLVNTLRETSPEFRGWWSDYRVSGQGTRIRRFRRPDGAVQAFEMMVLRMTDDFNSVILHLPVADQVHTARAHFGNSTE